MSFRDDEEIVETFIGETRDHLDFLEYGILKLENQSPLPGDEQVHAMFRAAHSIKAGANLLDLSNIEILSHQLENILQRIRSNGRRVDSRAVSVFLVAIDVLREMISDLNRSDSVAIEQIVQSLQDVY